MWSKSCSLVGVMPLLMPELHSRAFWLRGTVYFLVAALLFWSHSVQASSLQCAKVFTLKVSNAPIEILSKDEVSYMVRQVREDTDQNFSFLALYNKQSKSIEIRTMLVDLAGGERSAIKGHEAYKEMMEHFSDQNVRVVRGNWSQSDNSRVYLDNVRIKNMTPEEAALNTWSGKQAVAHGYTHAKVVFEGMVENKQGIKVYKIDVDFYKEEPRTGWRAFFFGD